MVVRALISALRFDRPDTQELRALNDAAWKRLLDFTDRTHMTLALAGRCYEVLPDWVRERIDRNIEGNAGRSHNIQKAYLEIAAALRRKGIEWAVLKGFAHDVPNRPQGDIDLLCRPEDAAAAQETAIALGYEPITKKDEFPADHLPLLIRRTGWRWRGDYFDPEAPVNLEIHFRLWDPGTECLPVEGLDEFWGRRQTKSAGGLSFPALEPPDTLAYAALHVFRHLLRGDLLLWHLYELALMLERLADDDTFWSAWRARYNESFRRLLAVPFRLAHQWFGCRLREIPALKEAVERWFEIHAREPTGVQLLADKSEVWLHVSLLESRSDALRVIRRKLLPIRKRRSLQHPYVRASEVGLKLRLERAARHTVFIAGRVLHHARTLPPGVIQGLLWWLRSRGLSSGFFCFLGAASLFNFGMTVFFLLYNLYLLKRGFHEDFLGLVTGALTTGSIAGTIPAGVITSRFGLKPALLFAFTAAPLICIVRTLAVQPSLLIASAFLGGFAMSMYAVALTPVVAQVTPEKSRPLAFSLVCSLGIGIGILGSAVGGAIPDWLGGLAPTLIAASIIAGLSVFATLRLKLATPTRNQTRELYPRDPAVTKYLAALALWSFATGALNPFFNVYFTTQLKAPLHTLGIIFSASQFIQATAVLAAPLVLRRLGLAPGIMAMQIATGVALGLLAAGPPLAGAAILYASYMAFQYMSEPGMFSFLMDHTKEEERGGAAALNFLILFAGQAIAATISGLALRRFGYAVVLTIASLLAMVAGLCFRLAMSREVPALVERSVAP